MTMIKNKRVLVAMSGGVDSAVTALILQRQGFEVIGVTMCFNISDSKTGRPSCCGIQGIEDAKAVAHKLGIKHYVLNFKKDLMEKVVKNFCEEYLRGRTPNPCIRCNQYLKFDALLKKALSLDCGYLATGHYARIVKNQLKKAKDKYKDQSYFLYRVNQSQLRRLLFPLGNLTKDEVRKIARDEGLLVADKPGSQEICFLPDDNYREFLKGYIKKEIKPGPIMDKQGKVLGQHKGLPFYTIGQREGLGIAMGYPVYVIKMDVKANSLVVSGQKDAYSRALVINRPHFITGKIKKAVVLKVKIRYNHKEAAARIIPFNKSGLKVEFTKPQFAITPGQSAVFYDNDIVLGGGNIDKVAN